MTDLRALARKGFDAAVVRADPARAVLEAFNSAPPPSPGGRCFVVAVGKAAPAMLRAALEVLDATEAICVTHKGNSDAVSDATMFYAGHPVPDADGAAAAAAVVNMLSKAGPDDAVIALISGGGSALLPAPPPGVSLADKQALNAALLASGLDITAMNTVRQQVSLLKGGGMAGLAAPAAVSAYILSDVIGDDLRAIASGPTVAPLGTAADALRIIDGLDVPATVLEHLSFAISAEVPIAQNRLIGSNSQSVAAAAEALSEVPTVIAPVPLVGDVAEAAHVILQAAQAVGRGPVALLWGGETTVKLAGTGLGGRNQELALRVANLAKGLNRDWVFLSGGTDGRDGPTDAAGGIVDPGTIARITAAGGDVEALLANNDSNAALRLAGDLLICGATGTNVADVQIMLLA